MHGRAGVFACPICTTPDWSRALCAGCADGLWRRREPVTRDLGAYRTHGLFAWRRDDWRGLRWWSAALKGKEHPVFWREAALWLTDVFGRPASGTSFVPVPGARGRNHARGLAVQLAAVTEGLVADVLEVVAGRAGHQRRLGLFERRGRRYRLSDEPPRGPVIVVDDVITSGATIEAAFRALGQPGDFAAWCLMDRRPPSESGPAAEGRDQAHLRNPPRTVGGA